MCSTALMVIGAGASAYSAFKQTQAANEAAEYNALMMEENAKIADQEAADAIERGEKGVRQHRKNVRGLKGSQRAALAASGVTVDQDTASDLVFDTHMQGEEDALTLYENADREARGYENQSSNYRQEAKGYRMSKRNPWENMGFSLLTSGSQFGQTYYRNKPTSTKKEG